MENKLTTAVIIFVAVFIGFVAYEVYYAGNGHTEAKYQATIAAQVSSDKCATPAGYTDEQWKQHMSHHPDMYEECLKK